MTEKYQKDMAERIRELRRDHGVAFAVRFAHQHGFTFCWALAALLHIEHHEDHSIIFPF